MNMILILFQKGKGLLDGSHRRIPLQSSSPPKRLRKEKGRVLLILGLYKLVLSEVEGYCLSSKSGFYVAYSEVE